MIANRFIDQGGSIIFWPSTIFLDDSNNEFQEYVAAKFIGEKVCEKILKETDLTILFPRLNKVSTDQTLSFLKEINLDAKDVAIDIVNLLCLNLKN